MPLIKKLILLGVSCVFCFSSYAEDAYGLFVEPGVTYEVSDAHINYPLGLTSSEASLDGFGLVARLGFHISESFFIAADGRYGKLTYDNATNNFDEGADSFNFAPVVGIQMPDFGLRVWGSYVLVGEVDPDSANGVDLKFTKPEGFRVGAGFRIAALSLNLEYQDIKYEELDVNGATFDNGVSFDNEAWVASVSFPLEL